MARLFIALVVAAALAGCAGQGRISEGHVPQEDPTFSDRDVPTSPPPSFAWDRLAEGDFRLDPVATIVRVPVTIPNATVKVMVNLTFRAGYTVDPRVTLDSCQQQIKGGFAAVGQTFPVDCGLLHDVTADLLIDHASGELVGRYTVDRMTCVVEGRPRACF